MAVGLFNLVDIQYCSVCATQDIRRQSGWHKLSFKSFKLSHTFMLKIWAGCLDDLFCISNLSYDCPLLVSSTTFILCSKYVLAALRNLQNLVHLGHCVPFPCFCLSLHFQVIFSILWIEWKITTCQYPVIGLNKLQYDHLFVKDLACGFWLPAAENLLPKCNNGLH